MLKLHEKSRDTAALMAEMGRRARAAARPLAVASAERKHAALIAMAQAILRREQNILDANAIDIRNGGESGLSAALMDVTADAGALCLKAGNPVILRGGSDSLNSSAAIHACLVEGLKAAKLPEDAIQLVPTADRAAVGEMLKGLSGNIDVII
ncbi:MAG: gamma-glutamyl-phosphate reductase, partial [Mesorhizobium sp.]